MKDCDQYQPLLMGLMDQELTPEETMAASDHLRRCASCREEYEHLREASGKLGAISFREPQDEILRQLWKSPFSRFTRNAGLLLVLGGVVALCLYGMYQFATQAELDVPALASATVWVGLAILFISVLRERLATYKSDPYREVKR